MKKIFIVILLFLLIGCNSTNKIVLKSVENDPRSNIFIFEKVKFTSITVKSYVHDGNQNWNLVDNFDVNKRVINLLIRATIDDDLWHISIGGINSKSSILTKGLNNELLDNEHVLWKTYTNIKLNKEYPVALYCLSNSDVDDLDLEKIFKFPTNLSDVKYGKMITLTFN